MTYGAYMTGASCLVKLDSQIHRYIHEKAALCSRSDR